MSKDEWQTLSRRVEELRNDAKKRMEITIDQKRAWLKLIVERSLQYEQAKDRSGNPVGDFKFDGKTGVSAIAELNKMDGDHAPTKTANTNTVSLTDFLDSLPEPG